MKLKKNKRCSKCNKTLRPRNKSGLCNYHSILQSKKEEIKKKCYICGEKCSGKMLIEWRKGTRSSFCKRHFNKLNDPMRIHNDKELREEMFRLKSLH